MGQVEPGRAGRPTKRTPAVEKRYVELIREGLTQRDAAAITGVSEDSITRWKQDFAGFADRIKKAEAEFILDNVRIVQKAAAAKETWTAAAWILERRRTETWGRKETVTVTPGGDGDPAEGDVKWNLDGLSTYDLRELYRIQTEATKDGNGSG